MGAVDRECGVGMVEVRIMSCQLRVVREGQSRSWWWKTPAQGVKGSSVHGAQTT